MHTLTELGILNSKSKGDMLRTIILETRSEVKVNSAP